MANYHYSSTDGVNFTYRGEVAEISGEYLKYAGTSFSSLYYITQAGKLTDIIAESDETEDYAREALSDTLEFVKSIV